MVNDNIDKRFQYSKAIGLIEETFGVDKYVAGNIVKEWRRDKMINAKMFERVSKYWRYISLPLMLDEDENF